MFLSKLCILSNDQGDSFQKMNNFQCFSVNTKIRGIGKLQLLLLQASHGDSRLIANIH